MPRLVVVLTALLAGCYGPKLSSPGFYCHAADNPACPNDQTCVDGRCVDKSAAEHFDLSGVTDGPPPSQDGSGPTDLARADSSKPADLSVKDSNGGPCGVKINEVQTAGATASDEFIELYNTCGTSIPLSGYKLAYRSAAGTTDVTLITFSSGSVPASGFFLCAGSGYAGSAFDVKYSGGSMAGAGGGVALLDGGGSTVDSVGYGTATNAFVKGSAAPAPAASQSIERLPDGRDNGNNATDFTIGAMPTPGAANQ
ncbi:MAG TPA: lamin tail domain-containing protein [Polyangia bacterium]|nr:lamin tail domain-containing protein [Polyangia bacterium]